MSVIFAYLQPLYNRSGHKSASGHQLYFLFDLQLALSYLVSTAVSTPNSYNLEGWLFNA